MSIKINEETGEATKVCTHCHRELPIEKFNKSKRAKDGYQCYCRECQASVNKTTLQETKAITRGLALGGVSTQELHQELKKRKDFDLAKAFTPRELMNALYDYGYRGTLTIVQTHQVTLSHD